MTKKIEQNPIDLNGLTKINKKDSSNMDFQDMPTDLDFMFDDPLEPQDTDLENQKGNQDSSASTELPLPSEQQQIVMPKKSSEIEHDKVVRGIDLAKQAEILKKRLSIRSMKNSIVRVAEQTGWSKDKKEEAEEILSEEIKQEYKEDTNTELPETINVLDLSEEIADAVNEIPDTNLDIKITEFDIIEVVKSKAGYTKTKVTINSRIAGNELSKIATIAKEESGSLVRHRVSDIRVIGNTNKTQLKGSDLKLLKSTYTFKPTGGVVNKATRVMLSVPEDFNTEKYFLIFIQKSRDKFIIKIDIESEEDIDWLGKFIGNYFQMTFNMAKNMLMFKNTEDELIPIATKLIKTGDFKCRLNVGARNKISSFTIITEQTKNQWLGIVIRTAKNPGSYYINLISKLDSDWIQNVDIKKDITLGFLKSNEFIDLIYSLYDKDDWKEFGIDFEELENKELELFSKLSYRNLKAAFNEIWYAHMYDDAESNVDLGTNIEFGINVDIAKTLSKIDTKASLKKDYQAEAIVGKTKYLDYFILSYLGVEIIGGDKRKGQQYITTEQYHEKYNVADKSKFDDRRRTTSKGRNYNARHFMFQLEYSIDEKPLVYKSKSWEDIKEHTKFLTKKPK